MADSSMAQNESPATGTVRTRRPGPLVWGAGVLACGFLILLLVAVLRPAEDNPLQIINRPAPDFTMSLYGGGRLHLGALWGKTVVLNFWWSGCIPCQQEAPLLERQWNAWKDKGVVFIGMDEIDDPTTSAPGDFLRTYHVTYPNGPDPSDVDIQYGTTGQPETFFITPRGRIMAHYVQPFTDDRTLTRLIEEAQS